MSGFLTETAEAATPASSQPAGESPPAVPLRTTPVLGPQAPTPPIIAGGTALAGGEDGVPFSPHIRDNASRLHGVRLCSVRAPLERYTVWVSKELVVVVGCDASQTRWRELSFDRGAAVRRAFEARDRTSSATSTGALSPSAASEASTAGDGASAGGAPPAGTADGRGARARTTSGGASSQEAGNVGAGAPAPSGAVVPGSYAADGLRMRQHPSVFDAPGIAARLADLRARYPDLKVLAEAWAIVGVIHLLENWYLRVVTEREQVGHIAGHAVFRVARTALIRVTHGPRREPGADEMKYLSLVKAMDLTKQFFYSPTYDLTRNVQLNTQHQGAAAAEAEAGDATAHGVAAQSQFVWNTFLLQPLLHLEPDAVAAVDSVAAPKAPAASASATVHSGASTSDAATPSAAASGPAVTALVHNDFVQPLIHGFFAQRYVSCADGTRFSMVLLSRRSRYFAGTRYLKRGVSPEGNVANEVETEQIVFEVPRSGMHRPLVLSSAVQLRGSIPVVWHHTNLMSPKPDVQLGPRDPAFTFTRRHFDCVERRYGLPLVCVSLIKERDSKTREQVLGAEFRVAIEHCNEAAVAAAMEGHVSSPSNGVHLPITYVTYDFLNNAKAKSTAAAMNDLSVICAEALDRVGIFATRLSGRDSGDGRLSHGGSDARAQVGVQRTNCVDCLDRTNVCQFVYGRAALRQQIAFLDVEVDEAGFSEMCGVLLEMFRAHGDVMAQQYAGSAAMHKGAADEADPSAVAKAPSDLQSKLAGSARNAFTAIKRYYSNTFLDNARQQAIDLFLGNLTPVRSSSSKDKAASKASKRKAAKGDSKTKDRSSAVATPAAAADTDSDSDADDAGMARALSEAGEADELLDVDESAASKGAVAAAGATASDSSGVGAAAASASAAGDAAREGDWVLVDGAVGRHGHAREIVPSVLYDIAGGIDAVPRPGTRDRAEFKVRQPSAAFAGTYRLSEFTSLADEGWQAGLANLVDSEEHALDLRGMGGDGTGVAAGAGHADASVSPALQHTGGSKRPRASPARVRAGTGGGDSDGSDADDLGVAALRSPLLHVRSASRVIPQGVRAADFAARLDALAADDTTEGSAGAAGQRLPPPPVPTRTVPPRSAEKGTGAARDIEVTAEVANDGSTRHVGTQLVPPPMDVYGRQHSDTHSTAPYDAWPLPDGGDVGSASGIASVVTDHLGASQAHTGSGAVVAGHAARDVEERAFFQGYVLFNRLAATDPGFTAAGDDDDENAGGGRSAIGDSAHAGGAASPPGPVADAPTGAALVSRDSADWVTVEHGDIDAATGSASASAATSDDEESDDDGWSRPGHDSDRASEGGDGDGVVRGRQVHHAGGSHHHHHSHGRHSGHQRGHERRHGHGTRYGAGGTVMARRRSLSADSAAEAMRMVSPRGRFPSFLGDVPSPVGTSGASSRHTHQHQQRQEQQPLFDPRLAPHSDSTASLDELQHTFAFGLGLDGGFRDKPAVNPRGRSIAAAFGAASSVGSGVGGSGSAGGLSGARAPPLPPQRVGGGTPAPGPVAGGGVGVMHDGTIAHGLASGGGSVPSAGAKALRGVRALFGGGGKR